MTRAQPSILLALLSASRWSDVRGLIGGWDMVNVECPTREQLQDSAAVLVGSGLAEWGEPWRLRLTLAGDELRELTKGQKLRIRQLPGELDRILAGRELSSVPVPLPAEVYDAALAQYLAPRRPSVLRRFWSALTGGRG